MWYFIISLIVFVVTAYTTIRSIQADESALVFYIVVWCTIMALVWPLLILLMVPEWMRGLRKAML